MDNRLVVFFGLLILVAVVISTFNEYDITGQLTRGSPGIYPVTGPAHGPSRPIVPEIRITSANCEWTGQSFWACVSASYGGLSNDYGKVFISGGKPIEKSPKQYNSPFIYCDDVGDTEGSRAAQAYVYSASDIYKDVDGTTVLCSKEKINTEKENVKFNFRAKTLGNYKSFGTENVRLSGRPLSCEYTGYYEIVDKKKPAGVPFGCNGGTGTLRGHIDEGKQYAYFDAGPFDWRLTGSKGLPLDPAEEYMEGYALYALGCDSINYFRGNNYARAKAKITDNGLRIDWEYSNDDTRPHIDFIVNFECKVRKEKVSLIGEAVKEDVIEESVEEVPRALEEIKVIETPLGAWERVKAWFFGLF